MALTVLRAPYSLDSGAVGQLCVDDQSSSQPGAQQVCHASLEALMFGLVNGFRPSIIIGSFHHSWQAQKKSARAVFFPVRSPTGQQRGGGNLKPLHLRIRCKLGDMRFRVGVPATSSCLVSLPIIPFT